MIIQVYSLYLIINSIIDYWTMAISWFCHCILCKPLDTITRFNGKRDFIASICSHFGGVNSNTLRIDYLFNNALCERAIFSIWLNYVFSLRNVKVNRLWYILQTERVVGIKESVLLDDVPLYICVYPIVIQLASNSGIWVHFSKRFIKTLKVSLNPENQYRFSWSGCKSDLKVEL